MNPNCTCDAYTFPHSPASGDCTGWEWTRTYFHTKGKADGGECHSCPHFILEKTQTRCGLIRGIDNFNLCPALAHVKAQRLAATMEKRRVKTQS